MTMTNETNMICAKPKPGHFYAVGVGPGASDLLTYRAAQLIESADIIIAPRSKRSKTSLALKTVEHLISSQEVIDHVYPPCENSVVYKEYSS